MRFMAAAPIDLKPSSARVTDLKTALLAVAELSLDRLDVAIREGLIYGRDLAIVFGVAFDKLKRLEEDDKEPAPRVADIEARADEILQLRAELKRREAETLQDGASADALAEPSPEET